MKATNDAMPRKKLSPSPIVILIPQSREKDL